jgi:hypothetical protein
MKPGRPFPGFLVSELETSPSARKFAPRIGHPPARVEKRKFARERSAAYYAVRHKKMKLPRISKVRAIFGTMSDIPGRFSSVTVAAGGKDVVFRCDPDTDELLVSLKKPVRRSKKDTVFVSGGFRVEWMWALKNQQGYEDGFRIQLGAKSRSVVYEVVSIGSTLEVHEAKMLPNHPPLPMPGPRPISSHRRPPGMAGR